MSRRDELLAELNRRQGNVMESASVNIPGEYSMEEEVVERPSPFSENRNSILMRELERRKSAAKPTDEATSRGLGHRAGEFGRGLLGATGTMLDVVDYASEASNKRKEAEQRRWKEDHQREYGEDEPYQKPGMLESAFKSVTEPAQEGSYMKSFRDTDFPTKHREGLPESVGLGQEFEPTDAAGRVMKGAGEFMAPIPIKGLGYGHAIKEVGKAGLKALPRVAAGEIGMAAGAAGALETPKLAKEETVAGTLEDFAKGIFGGMLGRKASDSTVRLGNKIISDGITKTAKDAPRKIAEKMVAAREAPLKKAAEFASMGARPDKEVFELAEKHGIDLPFNVGMDSRAMNFTANNYLKSLFTARVYEDTLKNSDSSMVRAVKRSIDRISPEDFKPSEGSGEFARFLKGQEKEAEEMVSKLYNNAESLLKKGESVVPKNTLKSISDMKELLTRDVLSPATKKVTAVIKELADKWELGPVISKKVEKEYGNSPIIIEKYLEALGKSNKAIPIDKLIGVRKELGVITKYDPDIKGVEGWLNGLKSQIDKDIDSSPNKAFVDAYRDANKIFKQEVADRFRGIVSRGLLSREMPREAFSLLNTPQNIQKLTEIAGTSNASKEILEALKKAKVKEVFANSLKDESLALAPFTNLFTKGEGKRELLKSLLGKQEFNNLDEMSKIASAFQREGRNLLNTSGTAIASADISKAEKLVKGTLFTILGGSGGAMVAGLPGAVAAAATPNLLSRLVSNKTFVRHAREYAVARQQGNESKARALLNNMIKTVEREQKIVAHLGTPTKKKEEK